MVLERQHPHKTVNLLYSELIVNKKFKNKDNERGSPVERMASVSARGFERIDTYFMSRGTRQQDVFLGLTHNYRSYMLILRYKSVKSRVCCLLVGAGQIVEHESHESVDRRMLRT